MKQHSQIAHKQSEGVDGFGLVELLIVVAIAFIMAAVAVPSFLQSYRTYELNDAASQVEMMLKYTRLEAVRLNTPISCWSRQVPGGNYQIWADSNKINNGVPQATEKQIMLNPNGNMVAAGTVPNTAVIAAATGAAQLTVIAPANAVMFQFDQRGALNPLVNPAPPYAVFLSNTLAPTAGYRAVIVLASGSTQIWSASANGGWHQTN